MTTRRLTPWLLVFGGALLLTTAVAVVLVSNRTSAPLVPPRSSNPADDVITSLGRISPDGDAVRISARSISGQPSLVGELLVKEGDDVKQGGLLAVLNSRDQLEAAWRAAEARMRVAERRLAQVKAGVKEADLSAQRAAIARLQTELVHAETELRRFEMLRETRAISEAEFDEKQLVVDVTSQELRRAREQLNSLLDVRDVDVALAEAEVESATMNARVARTEYEQSHIRAPIDGRVLEIHTRPGEELKPGGILELAKTDTMYVVAEVSDRDISRVRVGQRASVSSEALGAMEGVVDRIATKVGKNDVLDVDPTAMSDVRVVEVWIRLDTPGKAVGLINAEVTVRITP